MAVFHTYEVMYDAKKITVDTRFLNDYLFRASLVYHLQGANDICLYAQQLMLHYRANYYNKIKNGNSTARSDESRTQQT